MKPYASKCQLVDNADDGSKTYKVWIQKEDVHNGRTIKYTVTEYTKGKDMQSALRSVLRQPLADKLNSIPSTVYAAVCILGMAPWAVTFANEPFLALGLLSASIAILIFGANKYFKYNG